MNDLQALWTEIQPQFKPPRPQDARRALARAAWSGALSALVDAALLLWMGGFLYDHRAEPRFLLPALLLHAYLILSVVAQTFGLLLTRGIAYDAPITVAQRRLALLTRLRTRSLQWTLLTAPLIWIPLLIVLFKGALHTDPYRFLPPNWLWSNLAFGVAFIPCALLVSRWLAPRFERSRLLRNLAGERAGEEDDLFDEVEKG